jgi:uncharacterized protein YbgA (DUF1722 family)
LFLRNKFNFIINFSRKFSNNQINELKQMIEEYRHGNYIPLNKGKKN